MSRNFLPIDPLLPEAVRAVQEAGALVVQAAPGAGKTTRVPRALYEAGLTGEGELWVLQPRRLAARLAARRVAAELGEPLGETVGYTVRFESVGGPRTRLRFVTEGILERRLLEDPELAGISGVVLDEFHERHLTADLSLGHLRHLREGPRPELPVVVMSATLDAGPVATFLGGCPVLTSEGRAHPVEIQHLEVADDRPLERQVEGALKRCLAAGVDGHILVFLPGMGEIRRCLETLGPLAERKGLALHALHGDLSPAEQDRALETSELRKVILATNVAETSVTIEDVAVVIDSGLVRKASHSPWSGLPTLELSPISQASAVQRTGRAGRTREGLCVRLYTRHDLAGRPSSDAPEILRFELSSMVLGLRHRGLDPRRFALLDAPPEAALDSAHSLLRLLGALDEADGVTGIGRRMVGLPVHPRHCRLLIEAERRGIPRTGARLAALLGEGDARPRAAHSGRKGSGPARATDADPLDRLSNSGSLRKGSPVHRVAERLERLLQGKEERLPQRELEERVCLSLLAGYPDRVAKRRRPHSPEVLLCGGGEAVLSESSGVVDAELLVALEVETRRHGGGRRAWISTASRVEPEWLLELGESLLGEETRLEWNGDAKRVERVERLAYGALTLEESRRPPEPSPEVARLLMAAAMESGWLTRSAPLMSLRQRLEFLARTSGSPPGPRAGSPGSGERAPSTAEVSVPGEPGLQDVTAGFEAMHEQLAIAIEGMSRLAELEELDPAQTLLGSLSSEQRRRLERWAPGHVTLPGGRRLEIHYEADRPPWVESRLQDFFGMAEGPSLAEGRTRLVLHLLAPNQRAVQVTTDLAGFWERHYPTIRKELMRRYPRHSWPEDPLTATPPPPSGRRKR